MNVIEEINKRMSKRITNVEVSECLKLLKSCFSQVVFSNNLVKKSFKTSVSDKFSELAEKVCRG